MSAVSQSNSINPFADIYERHVDDAAFLWVLRSVAVDQPQYTPYELMKLEKRIEKHVDALMIAPDVAWEACQEACTIEEGGEAFIMAMCAFRSMEVDKIQKAVEFGLTNDETFKGITSALGWLDTKIAEPWVNRFIQSKDLNHKHLALAVCSIRREDPGEFLQKILTREDCIQHDKLYVRAIRLVGELKRKDLIPAVNQAMDSEDPDIVFWSHWSAVLNGNRAAVENFKNFTNLEENLQNKVIDLVFRILPVEEGRQWITQLSKDPESIRKVIRATGVLGDPQVVPWLIERMKEPNLARVAGEAFTFITGIDLEQHGLANDMPDLFDELEETDGDDDASVYSLEDENLPWPNTEKVAAVWQQYGNSFSAGKRYFLGRPLQVETLHQALKNAGQRHRHAAALELTLQFPEHRYVNTKAKVQKGFKGELK